MKKLVRPIITIGLGLVLALFSAAVTFSASSPALEGNAGAAGLFLQPTTTPFPKVKDVSEIGSTDGIIVLGFIIVLIIIIPILLQRKSWMES